MVRCLVEDVVDDRGLDKPAVAPSILRALMDEYAELLALLQKDLASAVRRAKLKTVPTEFLTVADRYGEPMTSPANILTLTDAESHSFSTSFVRWLVEKSKSMNGHPLAEIVAALEADRKFDGQYMAFDTIESFAAWYNRPENAGLDAFISYFIADGFPIYGVSLFQDRP
ncbi:hypothetical protein [Aeoliella sp. SH292]|uniref:hypothetical protein n=1 Tax=Aeoliella sp. SH292 TaxID=3454464 RepID=UPI003F9E13EE